VGIPIAVITNSQNIKRWRALLRKIYKIVLNGLLQLTMMSLDCFSDHARAQQRKIPKEPLEVVDASTGKRISELLLISRYSSFKGTSTLLGEGPGVALIAIISLNLLFIAPETHSY
jgi:hypothetical protein